MVSNIENIIKIQKAFDDIGYKQDKLLFRDHEFADITAPDMPKREVALAGFGQYPPSYRNSCIGFVNSNNGTQTGPRDCTALGAPIVFELSNGEVFEYNLIQQEMVHVNKPILFNDFLNSISRRAEIWSPKAIYRTKIGKEPNRQLGFIDIGFTSFLEGQIHEKLDSLLTNIVDFGFDQFNIDNDEDRKYGELFRVIFRFIAAKTFIDRKLESKWRDLEATDILRKVQRKYGKSGENVKEILKYPKLVNDIWISIDTSFSFSNLAVDDLAFIYESTFVNNEIREDHGIHHTPPYLAEYVVNRFDFSRTEPNSIRVLEPFSGAGAFLLAALRQLRDIYGDDIDPEDRHDLFTKALTGIEIDPFAVEVSIFSLILAGFPYPDDWNIIETDIFSNDILETELAKSNVVLCNPPYENFNKRKQESENQPCNSKYIGTLQRILSNPPEYLGFIIPKQLSYNIKPEFSNIRKDLFSSYENIEILELPDNVFRESESETVALTCSGVKEKRGYSEVFSVGRIFKNRTDLPSFKSSKSANLNEIPFIEELFLKFGVPSNPIFYELFKHLKSFSTVSDYIYKRGRGFVWAKNLPGSLKTSNSPCKGYSLGVEKVNSRISPYKLIPVYLNISGQYNNKNVIKKLSLPFDQPKIIFNSIRLSRDYWRLHAAIDREGLYFKTEFTGLWLQDNRYLEFICAVLNSPLANVWSGSIEAGRHNLIQKTLSIPVPVVSDENLSHITKLVRSYTCESNKPRGSLYYNRNRNLSERLLEIDAEILSYYKLPPRVEKKLLDLFSNEARIEGSSQKGYYEKGFDSAIPLKIYISEEFQKSSVANILDNIQPIDDPIFSEVFDSLQENDE